MLTKSDLPGMSLSQCAHSVVRATLPGESVAHPAAVGMMLATSPENLGELAPAERRIAGAAMIRARVYSAKTDDLFHLTEYEAESLSGGVGGSLPPRTRSLCHAVLAESYLSEGFAKKANAQARLAASFAHEANDDACLYRAVSLVACSLALNGEFTRADEASAQARTLQELHNWGQHDSVLPLLLADMMIAYGRLDAARLESILRDIPDELPGPVWLACEQLTTGWLNMLKEQYDQAATVITALTGGSDFDSIPKLVTGFALGLLAMAHIHREEPGRALAVLNGLSAFGDHALCFDLQRSTALLQLGEPRQALMVTDNCMRLGATHNLRTLPSILLRRAVANLRLGRDAAASRAFAEAFYIMSSTGSVAPLLGLPDSEIDILIARLLEQRPDLAKSVAEFRQLAQRRPHATAPALNVELTPRETVVADWLRSDLSLGEIAERLFVSRNTVKTHARSIYQKLGATSREEAVERLEGLGFDVRRSAGAAESTVAAEPPTASELRLAAAANT